MRTLRPPDGRTETEETVFDLPYEIPLTVTGEPSPRQTRLIYVMRRERLDDSGEDVLCLRFFDPSHQREGFTFGHRAKRVSWLGGGEGFRQEWEYSEVADDSVIPVMRSGQSPEGFVTEIVVRFRD
jgi:hypothetical protein